MRPHRAPSSVDTAVLLRLRGLLTASGPNTQELLSPVDGEPVGVLPVSTAADVDAAAQRARAAQPAWAAEPVRRRAQVLLDLHDAILDHRDELVDLLQAEGGKSRLSAVEEVLHTALSARYYGRTAARYLRSERGTGLVPLLTRVDRHFVPVGLVGVIAPWNYPLTLALSDGLAALVAGNAVLLKPDAQTPLVALRGVELIREAGVAADLWPVVSGPGAEVGEAVIEHSDYVCFTGSTRTGRSVAARCADRLIGCSLELGGKNPLLVLADADVEGAAAGAVRACFANAGQLCVSAERVYVAESVRDAFTAAFVSRTAALRPGYGPDFSHDLGGLINTRQLDTVRRHVADARAKGAQVLTGGRARPDLGPLVYEPTVLSGVTPEMECYADETFGPVVSLYGVADDDEAVIRANDSDYGLNASVWSADPEHARAVARRIRCGTVNVNDGYGATFASLDAPQGGMKTSGLGRRQGRDGIRRFVEVQAIATQSGPPLTPAHGVSPAAFTALLTGALRLLKKTGRP